MSSMTLQGSFRVSKDFTKRLLESSTGGIRRKIQEYVQVCEVCQRNKYQTLSPRGLLQPLAVPTQIWSDISMDFIGGLPKVKGRSLTLLW